MQGQSGSWLNTLYAAVASVSSVGPEVFRAGSRKGKNMKWHAIARVNWSLGRQARTQVALLLPPNLQLWWYGWLAEADALGHGVENAADPGIELEGEILVGAGESVAQLPPDDNKVNWKTQRSVCKLP